MPINTELLDSIECVRHDILHDGSTDINPYASVDLLHDGNGRKNTNQPGEAGPCDARINIFCDNTFNIEYEFRRKFRNFDFEKNAEKNATEDCDKLYGTFRPIGPNESKDLVGRYFARHRE